MNFPRLLVSVRSADEALAALQGGADWIDLKEPRRGSLGVVDAAIARDVIQCVDGRAPISAAAGELLDWPRERSRELLTVRGISYLKMGLSKCRRVDWRLPLGDAQQEMAAADMQLVAVIYADDQAAGAPRAEEIAEFAVEADCPWALVDTFDKSGGALGDHFSPRKLRALLQSLRQTGRRTVVAGSLTGDAISGLPIELVDMFAVRGAACEGGRHGAVSRQRVSDLCARLSTHGV